MKTPKNNKATANEVVLKSPKFKGDGTDEVEIGIN